MKQFSSKRSIQILAHLLKEYEIFNVVISPGSRNAPLAIHFSETDELNCYSIVDERSAGFVGLGMAKRKKKPGKKKKKQKKNKKKKKKTEKCFLLLSR